VGRGVALALTPQSPAWLVVAERAGEAVGVSLVNRIVSVEKGGLALWMEELYVVPEARRTGVARAMLQFLVDEGRRAGLRSLELEVVRTQAAAFALYRSFGFEDVDRARLTFAIAAD
jgi:ribosomal protein S18 acetylase RimI-like enzyme